MSNLSTENSGRLGLKMKYKEVMMSARVMTMERETKEVQMQVLECLRRFLIGLRRCCSTKAAFSGGGMR